jgi:hypothetical protein
VRDNEDGDIFVRQLRGHEVTADMTAVEKPTEDHSMASETRPRCAATAARSSPQQ